MKKLILKLSLFVAAAIVAVGCGNNKTQVATDYLQFVDPYIGSGGHGHVFVGASVPFGQVQVGPQNIHKGWDWCSGYHYSDSIIIGFSHTHLNGTGCADMGDILVMPYTGDVRTKRGEQTDITGAASSFYKHDKETVAPNYYSLEMENGVKAELTATEHAAMHTYTFPKGEEPHILINLKEGNGDRSVDTEIKLVDPNTIEGYRISEGWSPRHSVYFVMKTQTPIKELLVFNDDEPAGSNELKGEGVKGVIVFDGAPEKEQIKVAISSVSSANALANLNAEMPDWDFNKIKNDAAAKWNNELSRIDIKTNDEAKKKIFYTALYHTAVAPTLYSDVNGQFRGHDDKIYDADWKNYSTLSLWDTYRALNPLFTIIRPEMVPDIVNTMLSIYDQQGRLPIWPLAGAETECMPGYSAVPVIADAYLKGIKGFDPERALNAMKATTTYTTPYIRVNSGIPYVLDMEYIPCDKVGEATSKAMEYAVGDWGVAMMAEKMGKADVAKEYAKRGRYYAHYFDTVDRFVKPKDSKGQWLSPYDPFSSVHGGQGYFTEGTGWQYTFFVPQHPEGMIELLGGDDLFISKLDSLFIVEGDMGEEASADISGLIGQYAHGNEPSHHVVYLYPYAGQQWKTAEKVRFIQDNFYTANHDGVIGNEDCGQMSAWHILSALGFYQVNPSNGVFVFGSPSFDEATIKLPEGKTFTVIAEDNTKDNMYIQSVELNGQPYDKSFITYDDIMKGGTLKFYMGAQPNKEFGASESSRPKSL